MSRFVIYSTQRSGSTVLARSLDRHPEILCAGELFLMNKPGTGVNRDDYDEYWCPFLRISGPRWLSYAANLPLLRHRIRYTLNRFYNREDEGSGIKSSGFKLMLNQYNLSPSSYEKELLRHEVKKITLLRQNLFEVVISRIRNSKLGSAHFSGNNELNKIAPFRVEPEIILRKLERVETENRKILSSLKSASQLIIYYEDFSDWDNMLDKLYDFLGVKHEKLEPALSKISRGNYENEIENYAEIKDYLTKTNYKKFLEA